MGHEVTFFDTDEFALRNKLKPFSEKAKELLSEELPKVFRKADRRFDFFFSYLHDGQVYPQVLSDISKDIFTVNYSTNYHQFHRYEQIAKVVNANVYATRIAKESFDQLNVTSYWMPFAANPSFYRPSAKNNPAVVRFIGSVYYRRPYYIWKMLQNGINLHVYGSGWHVDNKQKKGRFVRNLLELLKVLVLVTDTDKAIPILYHRINAKIIEKLNMNYPSHVHEPLNDLEYASTLASSSIIVNISESPSNPVFLNHNVLLATNLRDFETTMSGTLLCTQYSDELPYFFEDGKEVVSYKNEYELIDKLNYFMIHDSERQRVAAAGYKRCITDHTWQKRFQELFNKINNGG
jgi:spore maturation protein CgeB